MTCLQFANKTVEQQLEDQFDVLAFSTTISNGNNAYIHTPARKLRVWAFDLFAVLPIKLSSSS